MTNWALRIFEWESVTYFLFESAGGLLNHKCLVELKTDSQTMFNKM